MIPSLTLSAQSSASSSATGGRISTGSSALNEGDWIINNAPNSAVGGQMNSKTMMYVAVAAAAYYFLVVKKKAA